MPKQSRRRFLLASAAAATVPFVRTSTSEAKADMSQKKIGFAVCGLGGLSEHQIMPAFAKSKHCKLTGLITGTPEKRHKFGS
ncbi:MAG TPA: hypothetical protein VKB34_02920, partial [Povalibacter sp.]|nr:hypothetical protein [Povalibacter sp.]